MLLFLQALAFGQDSAAVAGMQKGTPQNDRVKAEVSRLLESTANRDQAWAAYLIGKYELREVAAQIHPLLNPELNGQEDEVRFVHLAALDSLIQLGMTVPSDKLMPLYNKFPNEVLILLAKAPNENQQALLSIAQQAQRQAYWMAACNLLAESKARGFAAWLIKELKIEVRITVLDHEDGGTGTGIGCGMIGIDASVPVPDGFPPTALYFLKESPERGAVVVAPGHNPIYYKRTVSDRRIIADASFKSCNKNHYNHLEYLAALLNTTADELKLEAYPSHSITWQGAEKYQRKMAQIQQQVKASYEQVIQRLLEKNLLTDSEADGLAPMVVVTIEDLRKNPSVPLPAIPGVVKSERQ
jgi:hypothetical protein